MSKINYETDSTLLETSVDYYQTEIQQLFLLKVYIVIHYF
jgi:hypothetical protein